MYDTVVLVELDPTVGREQRGVRPCVAVSDPSVNADQRFPLIAVVPVTGTAGVGALYPALSPGPSGLTKRYIKESTPSGETDVVIPLC
jgi:mRNA-degrading endonuclease toxin of MazEF toxin-antitoxin module